MLIMRVDCDKSINMVYPGCISLMLNLSIIIPCRTDIYWSLEKIKRSEKCCSLAGIILFSTIVLTPKSFLCI